MSIVSHNKTAKLYKSKINRPSFTLSLSHVHTNAHVERKSVVQPSICEHRSVKGSSAVIENKSTMLVVVPFVLRGLFMYVYQDGGRN